MDNANGTGLTQVGDIARKSSPMKGVVMLMSVVVDCVAEAGELGAPGGLLYAAMMGPLQLSLSKYQGIMDGLVKAGFLVRHGHVYHATEAGRAFAKLNGTVGTTGSSHV